MTMVEFFAMKISRRRGGWVLAVIIFIVYLLGSVWFEGGGELSRDIGKRKQSNESIVTGVPTIKSISVARQEALVVKVIDGDTIAVSINGKNETVRVMGIDTPEVVDPRKTIECLGKEASGKAKIVFEDERIVFLEFDPTQGDRDKYRRLLRYVWIDKGVTDFGKMMISEGFASEYTYSTPYKYQGEYREAEKQAREAKRGLWADGACAGYATPVVKELKVKGASGVAVPTGTNSGGDRDCPDFATQAEAQFYFDLKGGSPTNNVDRLDADGDGVACESLR